MGQHFRTDSAQIWGHSEYLKIGSGKNAAFLKPNQYFARSFEDVQKALGKVRYTSYSSDEI